MKNFVKKHGERGFSLVELMIVVGIIGVLATLALPRFKQFQAKAKMGEAKNLLSHLYTLEQTYTLDNNQYITMGTANNGLGAGLNALATGNVCDPASVANAQALGFTIDPCTSSSPLPRFMYWVTTPTTATFLATASTGQKITNRICPGANNKAMVITVNDGNAMNDAVNGTFGVVCKD